MLVVLAGCERPITALSLREPPVDAGEDAAYPAGDPRFEDAGSRADFEAAVNAFSGRFAGRMAGDEPMNFTLELTPSAHGHGSFRVQCEEPGCDPFGVGSSLVERGSFSLVQVNARGEGEGQFAWTSSLAPVQADFWQLEIAGDQLRFAVGHLGLERDFGVYAHIELTRTGAAP